MSAQGQAHGTATATGGAQSCQHALTLWGSRWYREAEKGEEDCGLAVSLKQKGNKGRKGLSRKRERERAADSSFPNTWWTRPPQNMGAVSGVPGSSSPAS